MRLLLLLLLTSPLFADSPRWQVFLLVGQSNMEGKGRVEHLDELCASGEYPHLRSGQGWQERDDVFIDYLDRRGPLTVGYGTNEEQFGPELGIGHRLGEAIDEPVLLIKLAWGGKSVMTEFRPPSAGGEVGPNYLEVIARTKECLDSLDERFPGVDAEGYDLRGLIWFQGWNDRVNQAANDAYEDNLTHLIGDLRGALGHPNLPVVIGETGQGGPDETHPRALSLMRHQAAVARREELRGPEGEVTVRFVPTRHIWHVEPRFDGEYHWLGNARNFYELGDAMGLGMLRLLAPRPNVVLVMSDDQGWGDLGMRHQFLKTPNLDALATQGVHLTHFYAAAPVCSPTRGSVLTGRHPARYGIQGANSGHLPEDEVNLARLLKETGYTTGFFGKWHLGTLTKDVLDSNRGGKPDQAKNYAPPWDRQFDVVFATEAKVPTVNPMLKEDGSPYGTAYWTGPGERVPDEQLTGDDSAIVFDQAMRFIESAQEPFFCVVWLHSPHEPVRGGHPSAQQYSNALPENHRNYYGCLTDLDAGLGELRSKLTELGLAENTLLHYCSDNGPEHRDGPGFTGGLSGRKRDLLEGGIRVPAMITWPAGLDGAREFGVPACTTDLLPTVLDAARIPLPEVPLDGQSLLPRLDGSLGPVTYGFTSNKRRAWVTTRGTETWKIHSTDAGKTWTLKDIGMDPSEGMDFSVKNAEQMAEMLAAFEAWYESL